MSGNQQSNNPNQQQPAPTWESASLATFLRSYFPQGSRANYDFAREIQQARSILNCMVSLQRPFPLPPTPPLTSNAVLP